MTTFEVPVDRWLHGEHTKILGSEPRMCRNGKADIVGWLLHALRNRPFKAMNNRYLPDRDDTNFLIELLGQKDYDALMCQNDTPSDNLTITNRKIAINKILRKHKIQAVWT